MSGAEPFDQHNTITLGNVGGADRVLKPGDIVGSTYRLKTLIGHGGMGYVFCAEHTIIERDYALKIMAPEQINEVSWRRFESEARAIAALDHPNIVKVYNMGVDAGNCPFYVMDLLIGTPLSEQIKPGKPIDQAQLLDILIQTASGLGYAHHKGIVHRDVKPSNIMIVDGPRGQRLVKIVDFGLAKLVKDTDGSSQKLTNTGDVFGTPYYMSPEQCMGANVDGRSDIYSLGCSLYEMIMGVPPFAGPTPLDTVLMHINEPVPSTSFAFGNYQTEQSMNLLLSRMLCKRREDRYQTMAQLVHDLERIRDRKEIGRQGSSYRQTKKPAPDRSLAGGNDSLADEKPEAVPMPAPLRLNWLIPCVAIVAVAVAGFVAVLHSAAPDRRVVAVDSRPAKILGSRAGVVQSQRANVPDGVAAVRSRRANSPDSDEVIASPIMPEEDPGDKFRSAAVRSDPRIPEATEKLKRAKVIDATTLAGVRTIHFPSYPLGKLLANLNPFGEAKGDRIIDARMKLGLVVNWFEDPCTLYNPFIFEQIDKDLFTSLKVVAVGCPVASEDGQESDIQVTVLLTILKAAAKWTNLSSLGIEHFNATAGDNRLLTCLDDLPYLTDLDAPMGELNLKDVCRHRFVKRLKLVDVDSTPDIDYLLAALAGSQELNILMIGRTNPSPSALLSLKTCANLWLVNLRGSKLSHAQIEALSKLSSVRELFLRDFHPTKEDLMILARSGTLRKVYLSEADSNPQEKSDWPKILPCLEFRNNI